MQKATYYLSGHARVIATRQVSYVSLYNYSLIVCLSVSQSVSGLSVCLSVLSLCLSVSGYVCADVMAQTSIKCGTNQTSIMYQGEHQPVNMLESRLLAVCQ